MEADVETAALSHTMTKTEISERNSIQKKLPEYISSTQREKIGFILGEKKIQVCDDLS